jgi:maltose O-acetyltransferase
MGTVLDIIDRLIDFTKRYRTHRRWARLQRSGMKLGNNVRLPASTWIDTEFCYLISIGDNCRLGDECLILAHDAQMDEFLDAGRIGRVVIHADCSIGARTTILPGVEIGPRTVVAAQSVVLRSLPADSYCAGNPARVVSTVDELIGKLRDDMQRLPRYDQETFERLRGSEAGRATLRDALAEGGYVAGDGSVSG